MEWTDEGFVLSVRPHGEASAIVDLLTRDRGRHAGLVRGGRSRRLRPVLQPGNKVSAVWKARLEDHLGSLTVELDHPFASVCLSDQTALEALNAACGLMLIALPEREKHETIFNGFEILMRVMDDPQVWPAVFVRWELGVLQELGFQLDLSKCAASGETTNLTYVSPKTGRAVSGEAAAPYVDKLLPLPSFLLESQDVSPSTVQLEEGFDLTGYFLIKWVLGPSDKSLPEARYRLVDRLTR